MQKLKFIFGIHCHQPPGSFEHVFNQAFEQAYLPFLKTLSSHPQVKFTVHYSGILYDWFIEKHPEFIELLKKLVKRGQVEMLSGGYYEPILSVIPDEDKLGQIEMENQFIKENFGKAPRGMWLAEGVWEPTLPKVISRAEIEYAPLDDEHFIQAGVNPDKLFGYYITEEEGETLKLFPISRKLRELIPFQSPEEIVKYLKAIPNSEGTAAAVFMAEPETHKRIYEDGYLGELLSLLEANSDWLECTTFSNYLDEFPSQGRIYLPSDSYFRKFFVKYPEANNMHKKMLYISNRLRTLNRGKTLIGEHKKNEGLKKARRELYRGQCNSAYGHGIHLNYLRQAVYSHLIQSEIELEKFSRGEKPYVELTLTDFDKDGEDEVILSNSLLNLYLSPKLGGSLFELDYKPKAFNLINTLAREEMDWHPRSSLLDHFLAPETNLEGFSSLKYREPNDCWEAGDFVLGAYSFMPKRKEAEVGLRLSREGKVEGAPVKVEKSISLFSKQSIFVVEYEITNLGEEPDEFWFGVEFNFSLLAGDKTLASQQLLASKGETNQIKKVKLVDEGSGFDVSLETNQPALLWRFPIENKYGYQSSVVFPSWKFNLDPKETWSMKICVRIEE